MKTLLIFNILIFYSVPAVSAEPVERSDEAEVISRWSPPDATARHSLGSADAKIQCVKFQSEASFADVWNRYARKIGSQSVYRKGRLTVEGGVVDGARFFIRDTLDKVTPPARKTLMVYRSGETSVMLNLSRAADHTLVEVVAIE